jgi:hypothetical protein
MSASKKAKEPKDRSAYPSTAEWATMPNEERGRPMFTLTMSPEGKAELDRMRGKTPRGEFIEQLLAERKSRKKTKTT